MTILKTEEQWRKLTVWVVREIKQKERRPSFQSAMKSIKTGGAGSGRCDESCIDSAIAQAVRLKLLPESAKRYLRKVDA